MQEKLPRSAGITVRSVNQPTVEAGTASSMVSRLALFRGRRLAEFFNKPGSLQANMMHQEIKETAS
jgi:hypothetical protein